MKEIKFRGNRVNNGKWVYGLPLYSVVGAKVIIDTIQSYEDLRYYTVIPETVGQFTGLHDEKGKEIYEGDIVVFEDMTSTESGYWGRDCIGIVVWGEETAAFEVTNRLSAESYEVLSDCEVIGNIHTNPELLKEVSYEA